MVGRRGLHRRLDSRLARAALQPRQFIAQLLILGPQGGDFRSLRLNEVEQLGHELAESQVGYRVEIDVGELHTWVVYQTSAGPSPSAPAIMEQIRIDLMLNRVFAEVWSRRNARNPQLTHRPLDPLAIDRAKLLAEHNCHLP